MGPFEQWGKGKQEAFHKAMKKSFSKYGVLTKEEYESTRNTTGETKGLNTND